MSDNTLIGDHLGIRLPVTRTRANARWNHGARLGPNLAVFAREGVAFTYASPRPGVHIIVEFPDVDGLRATVPYAATDPNMVAALSLQPRLGAEGAGFWVGLAEGIGTAANTITFGLVDGILKYDPKAQKKVAEGERARAQAQIDAQAAAVAAQTKAENDALIARAEAEAEIMLIMARTQRRLNKLNGLDDRPDYDVTNAAPAIRPIAPVVPAVRGACCSSCAVGGPCEGACHGH